jgi:uncharacterized protein
MAGMSLLALLDDIASVLDDVATLTKVAAKNTAGVLGDDLALNAQQVSGVRAERELPVVWAVAKGSALNKAILVPVAIAISALAPWAVLPLLMIGGAFLCFEGAEKLAHKWLHRGEAEQHSAELARAVADPNVDLVAFERDKVKAAIRTDFILSAEIIVISLGAVASASLGIRIAVLCGVSVLMTVGVYGLVAGIVKIDDAGLALSRRGDWRAPIGRGLLALAPVLMRFLSIAGTAAMFLVGGGIVVEGIAPLHHALEDVKHWLAAQPGYGGVASALAPSILKALVGLALGAALVAASALYRRLRGQKA